MCAGLPGSRSAGAGARGRADWVRHTRGQPPRAVPEGPAPPGSHRATPPSAARGFSEMPKSKRDKKGGRRGLRDLVASSVGWLPGFWWGLRRADTERDTGASAGGGFGAAESPVGAGAWTGPGIGAFTWPRGLSQPSWAKRQIPTPRLCPMSLWPTFPRSARSHFPSLLPPRFPVPSFGPGFFPRLAICSLFFLVCLCFTGLVPSWLSGYRAPPGRPFLTPFTVLSCASPRISSTPKQICRALALCRCGKMQQLQEGPSWKINISPQIECLSGGDESHAVRVE